MCRPIHKEYIVRNLSLLTIALASTVALSGCVVPGPGYAPQQRATQYNSYAPQPQQQPTYGYSQPQSQGYQQPQSYQQNQNYQQQQNVQYGVVTSVRPVVVQGEAQQQAPIGALLGAVAGGVVGNQMGKGRGHVVGAVAGAALGGLAGNAIQHNMQANNNTQNALEITVRLRNGSNVVVTQSPDQQFNAGDRVSVVQNDDGSSTVSH
jgi:outer membrane lipoprotein SlyB